ncbi:hypothetical protein [Aureimonas sp. Leaf454]|uniref:hypothetical protein n=1 Tax=Aureimonas sp. Leaf454 TaxID=1736381 RepID=UPI000A71326F|nr:hypothetical protein [Aureimonas sp. Leaf454]
MTSAMERSLRRALDAGDASDPAFRETIYAASERALERMLEARPVDEASAQAQRIRLAETINLVEQDYYAAAAEREHLGPETDETFERPEDRRFAEDEAASFGADPEADADLAPSRRGDEASPNGEDGGRPDKAASASDDSPAFLKTSSTAQADASAGRRRWSETAARGSLGGFGAGRRTNSRLRLLLLLALVFAALLVIFYLVYGMVFGTPASEATGTASSSLETPPGEDEWIALFDGTQLSSIATPTGGRVEAVTGSGDMPAVRMTSAGEGGEIAVAVGPGVVRELAGKTVRVEVTVGSPDGSQREFGVRCPFGGETACGRQRFTTSQSSESFIFEMSVPSDTRDAGSIAFDPGFGEEAKPLDLYGVRARVTDDV